MNSGFACGIFNFFLAHFTAHAVGDIVTNRAGEQERFLLHNANLRAQIITRIVVEVYAIQQNSATVDIIKTWQKVDQ